MVGMRWLRCMPSQDDVKKSQEEWTMMSSVLASWSVSSKAATTTLPKRSHPPPSTGRSHHTQPLRSHQRQLQESPPPAPPESSMLQHPTTCNYGYMVSHHLPLSAPWHPLYLTGPPTRGLHHAPWAATVHFQGHTHVLLAAQLTRWERCP